LLNAADVLASMEDAQTVAIVNLGKENPGIIVPGIL
jgi:hypothetical protein